LVVGINSDRYIRETKGYEPLSQVEREKILMSRGFIREVVVFDEPDPREFIRRVNPDVHCTGEEYRGRCPEAGFCAGLGIKVIYIPRIGNWSTRAMIKGEVDYAGNVKSL
jgi:bifunctional ADP-heptose synthase (sugar kinase/adenylyltransferase)